MSTSGVMDPPKWDESMKDFEMWLAEVHLWKQATQNVPWLKDSHGATLTLGLPEGSEIRNHILQTIQPDDMKGDDGWAAVIELIKEHYRMDEVAGSFTVWKEFRELQRQQDQSVDQYILSYERFVNQMKRYKIELPP